MLHSTTKRCSRKEESNHYEHGSKYDEVEASFKCIGEALLLVQYTFLTEDQ